MLHKVVADFVQLYVWKIEHFQPAFMQEDIEKPRKYVLLNLNLHKVGVLK